MKKITLYSLLVGLALGLAACSLFSSSPSKEDVKTSVPEITQTGPSPATPGASVAGAATSATASPPTETPTRPPTPIPTFRVPVLVGTGVPQPADKITRDTLDRASLIAHWGMGRLNQLAWSPDGRQLAVAATGLYLYDSQTLQPQQMLEPDAAVTAASFAPDGKRLAALSDYQLTVWELPSARVAYTMSLDAYGYFLTSVAFSPDSARLAFAEADGRVKVCDAAGGREIYSLTGHSDRVTRVVFSPDGKYLATASDDQTVRLWAAADGAAVVTLTGHTARVQDIAFSPDGARLVSVADYDPMARVWQVATGQELGTLEQEYMCCGAAYSPDGVVIATASSESHIQFWEAGTGRELYKLGGFGESVQQFAFSPDGGRLAVGGQSGIEIFDASSRQVGQSWYAGYKTALGFSADGARLVWGAQVRDLTNGQLLLDLGGRTSGRALSPDGKVLAEKGQLRDVESGQALRTFSGGEPLAFSPDGQWIAGIGDNGKITLSEVATGKLARTFTGHTQGIGTLAFSPDSTLLAAGSTDKNVYIWDLAAGALQHTLRGHSNSVTQVVFSPDGTRLASRSQGEDYAVKVWDVQKGQVSFEALLEYKTRRDGKEVMRSETARSVAFSPDGALLLVARYNSAAAWDVATG